VARALRVELPGATYHVTARGNAQSLIFDDDKDRQVFLTTLERVVERFAWRCLAYCLMGNHYHLVVTTPEPNLARGMRQLNGVYAQSYNRRHGRVGHVFQDRYAAVMVQTDHHLFNLVGYVAMNPVEAGFCKQPESWPWGSHAETLGLRPASFVDTDSLFALLSPSRRQAVELYRYVVGQRQHEEPRLDVAALGDNQFVRDVLAGAQPSPEVPRRQWDTRPPLADLLASDDSGRAIVTAYRQYGYSLREISEVLGCHYSTVSRKLRAAELGAV
jgi:REP element-mobilizing transposase RayT